jgi:hypothetical protein
VPEPTSGTGAASAATSAGIVTMSESPFLMMKSPIAEPFVSPPSFSSSATPAGAGPLPLAGHDGLTRGDEIGADLVSSTVLLLSCNRRMISGC